MSLDFEVKAGSITDDIMLRVRLEALTDLAGWLEERLPDLSGTERALTLFEIERSYDLAFRYWQKQVLELHGIVLHVIAG